MTETYHRSWTLSHAIGSYSGYKLSHYAIRSSILDLIQDELDQVGTYTTLRQTPRICKLPLLFLAFLIMMKTLRIVILSRIGTGGVGGIGFC